MYAIITHDFNGNKVIEREDDQRQAEIFFRADMRAILLVDTKGNEYWKREYIGAPAQKIKDFEQDKD